jgi:ATP-binding cassette subfamily B (MDR/TAP) protein 1
MLLATLNRSYYENHKAGLAFGFSQFSMMFIFAALFYSGAKIMEHDKTIKPEDLFIAIFSMMFGAQQAGNSQQFGPDFGKATSAAKRIFSIMDEPSHIDAIAINGQADKKKILPRDVKGAIEFKNVWFRYPTRKADWVLKGLNLRIEPKETVALVGESGCGKSTFVSLLMRFYDVDFGEILLDGVNIQEYNLHDLRFAMSMVMQEPILFNYSIVENILYGKPEATNTEIDTSAQVANAIEFLSNFDQNQGELLDASSAGDLSEMLHKHKS